MAYNFTNISVLLVNDVASTRKIMATALQMNHVKAVHEAAEGNQAFRMFKEHNPDVVITELNMNPMDGRWLAKKIRAADSKSPNRAAPIILISGDAGALDIPDIRDNGFDELLMVPFSVGSIADRVAYVLNNPREFVESDDYAGPDRRRKSLVDYEGPFRRAVDPADKKNLVTEEKAPETTAGQQEVPENWPAPEESQDMLNILFEHYIQHHEIVLKKLKLAQEATGKSEQENAADADALWKEVIGLFANSGMSGEEMSKIEGMMKILPKDIETHFEELSQNDTELQKMEEALDQTGYERAHQTASDLQAQPNPLSGMKAEDYHSEEQSPEEQKTAKVEAFKFTPAAGKFKR